MKNCICVGLFILTFSLNAKENYSDRNNQPYILASDIKVEAYISGSDLQSNEKRLNSGQVLYLGDLKSVYEIIKLGDGTCVKRTTHLHGMKEFPSAIPGLVIRAPATTSVKESVSCDDGMPRKFD